MKKDPKTLYQEVILRHNKSPFHYEKRENAAWKLDAYNPICGDRFSIYLDIEGGKITDLHFHGYGCTISKASTSLLAEKLTGLTVEEALARCHRFLAVIHPEKGKEQEVITEEAFAAFAPARDFPGRDTCATLSWDEMRAFLADFHS